MAQAFCGYLPYRKHFSLGACFFAVYVFSLPANESRYDDNKSEWSPLMLAIHSKNNAEAQRLIQNGADIMYSVEGFSKRHAFTAMFVAIFEDNEDAVLMLLKTKKQEDINDYYLLACGAQNVFIVKLFLFFGADINYVDEDGCSAVFEAAYVGKSEVLEYLLEMKANPNLPRISDQSTALIVAVQNCKWENVKLLIKYGVDKYHKNKFGMTAYNYFVGEEGSKDTKDAGKNELRALLK
ncbi:MAG: ankyrin repeat domain-containing protein [Spirochaetaceae bacterium]|jgi:ankyrin repeat protein|nr:ankyrin repeat domain-containing protein [Spirochaetaceae bacterium]